jgi:hypothetical protein
LRYVVKRRYLKLGSPRCRHEFELLQNVRNLGIAAPEPVAFAYSGILYYLGWLITRAIEQPKSLVHLANTDTGTAQKVMPLVIEQISKLVQHRIQHIDLHPGNVIVDSSSTVSSTSICIRAMSSSTGMAGCLSLILIKDASFPAPGISCGISICSAGNVPSANMACRYGLTKG